MKKRKHEKLDKLMKRVLITGAGSYIGEAFEKYAGNHYKQEFTIDTVDMLDENWRQTDFSQYDVVFHVAGIAHADVENVTDETKALYYRVNTDLAVETAEIAKAAGVKQFIFMSSMIIYGGLEHVTKDTMPQPSNFYGDSKWQADEKIRALNSETFRVVVLRPPMIYGKGSKGNYPVLAKLARKLPIFPKVKNIRSMLYIENLCEFLCLMIKNEERGIFFPQNESFTNTGEMVVQIAKVKGHAIWSTILLAPAVTIGKHCPGKIGALCNKAFGNSYYDLEMSEYKEPYRVCGLEESIRRTEG